MPQYTGSDAFYESIELSVRATGQQAVNDLNAEIRRLANEIMNWQSKMIAGTATTKDAQEALEKLSQAYARATEGAMAGNRVMNGQSAALDTTTSSAKGLTRALLESSRAFEDMTTGGFLGALNNIPGIFGGIARQAGLASPAVAGVETAASVLATTSYLVYQNWGKIKKLFDDGLGPKLIDDVESVTKALKELTEKEWKTRIDVQDINIAKAELDKLTKAKQGYDKLNATTSEQKATGEAATKAIVESGVDRATFTRAVITAAAGPVSPEVAEMQKKIEQMKATIEDAKASMDFEGAGVLQDRLASLEDSKEGRRAVEIQNRSSAVQQQLGEVANGDPMQVKWLQDLYNKNRDKFKAVGVKDSFGADLDAATPEARARSARIDAEGEEAERQGEESIREIKAFSDKKRAEAKGQATEKEQRTNQAVNSINPGVDEKLEKSLYDFLKAGGKPDEAKGKEYGGLVTTLKGRGVADDVVGDVAARILQRAAERAQNLIAEGDKPKVDVEAERKSEQAKRAADHDKRVKAQADDHAKTARKHKVDALAPGFLPQAEAIIDSNRLAQATGDRSMQREAVVKQNLTNRAAQTLKDSGQDPGLAPDIVAKAFENSNTKYTAALAQTGNNVQALIQVTNAAMATITAQQAKSQQQSDQISKLNFWAQDLGRNQQRMATKFPSLLPSY